jgi:hypothetical protein
MFKAVPRLPDLDSDLHQWLVYCTCSVEEDPQVSVNSEIILFARMFIRC